MFEQGLKIIVFILTENYDNEIRRK